MNGKFKQFVFAESKPKDKCKILFFAGNFFNMVATQNGKDYKKIDGNLAMVKDQIKPGDIVNHDKFVKYIGESFKVVHNVIDHNGCEGFDGDNFPSYGFEHWACLRLMEYISHSYPKYECIVESMSWAQYFPSFERIGNKELVVSIQNGMENLKFDSKYNDDPPLVIVDAGSSKTKIQLNKSHVKYNDAKLHLEDVYPQKISALHKLGDELGDDANTEAFKTNTATLVATVDAFIFQCNDICRRFGGSKILIATAGMRDFVNANGLNKYTADFCEKFGPDSVYIIPGTVEALFEHNACTKIIESKTTTKDPQVIMCSMGGQSTQMSDGNNVASYDTMGAISMQKTCKCSEKRAFNDVLAPSLKDEVLNTLLAFEKAGFTIDFKYIPNI
tara:strand:+ start:760 stop:1923 length:1164 start_codon:yes stop_codon:yes gene_type:complete